MRIHQYAKNSLIFLPILLSHQFTNVDLFLQTLLGFICFSLVASSAYLLNDLVDLPFDRLHPIKRYRPMASGALSLLHGAVGSIGLFCIGLFIAGYGLPIYFSVTVLFYYSLTLAYSFQLKKLLWVDVLTLAILYVLRIIAGMAIMGPASYSKWLLLFSFFFFLSLALMKRFTELKRYGASGYEKLPGRAYHVAYHKKIKIMGLCSGFCSILIFALYAQSKEAQRLYHHPAVLFLICALILYWLLRAWMLAVDEKMDDDPVVFALKDGVSYCVGVVMIGLVVVGVI